MSNEPKGKRRGLMLVLSSPSGAGKTTLAHLLMDEFKDVRLSVSVTTRARRPNEVDGVDYHFRSAEAFKTLIAKRGFLEWARVFDNFYGTLKSDTISHLDQGTDVLFDVDWQGADALHDHMPNDCVSIFILPPSVAALSERLSARNGSTPETVARRMQEAHAEIKHWRRYDYCIVNDDLDKSYQKLKQILMVERLKRLRLSDLEHHVRGLLDEF